MAGSCQEQRNWITCRRRRKRPRRRQERNHLAVVKWATEGQITRLKLMKRQMYGIHPPKAVCADLVIGFKSMPDVMRYSHFPH